MRENWHNVLGLFERGGEILWVIGGMSFLLWWLLVDRALFLWWVVPSERGKGTLEPADFERHLASIQALVFVLPLVGLLGTVVGMIQTFDVLSVFGASNPRGLSTGISQALLTTMAGLVTSLSGLLASSALEKRLRVEQDQLPATGAFADPWAVTPLLRLRSRLGGVADSVAGGTE